MSGTASLPVVVLGAAGGIGRGVVQAALDRGRPVIAVARNPEALESLRALAPNSPLLTLLQGAVDDDAAGAVLASRLRELDRPLGGVVACICGALRAGRLLDQPAELLRRRLDEDLLPHLAAARHLLPLLADVGRNSTYVLIGGPGGEQPWAGYGHRSVGTAALRMLARVLHDEARAQGVRVQLLSVDSPVRTGEQARHCCPRWPSALAVGQRALALVDRDGQPPVPPVIVRYADGGDQPMPLAEVVETAPAGSSNLQEGAATAPSELLPEGCQQPVRTLLDRLLPPRPPLSRSPHDKERPL
ncbi:SDR family NAD(P)-dependent oxidoreductase [Marilutibacter alkalisoli]|nr:SDR family oxidoreductase [Lysobacter alkalisoli]